MIRLLWIIPIIVSYILGAIIQHYSEIPTHQACDMELKNCADDLADAEITLSRAKHATQLAEIVLMREQR